MQIHLRTLSWATIQLRLVTRVQRHCMLGADVCEMVALPAPFLLRVDALLVNVTVCSYFDTGTNRGLLGIALEEGACVHSLG